MTPERWVQIKELFQTALDVTQAHRDAYLAERCGNDRELLGEVSQLLRQHQNHAPEADEDLARAGPESLPRGEPPLEGAPEPSRPQSLGGGASHAGTTNGATGDSTLSVGAGRSAAPTRLTPRCFGDYELLAEIAHGGMGVVYKARQISLQRIVALKTILAGQFASDAEIRRFQTEALAAATLDHRHIVGIYEIGCQDGQHYFTMQYIDGHSLAHRAHETRWRAGNKAARLMAKAARAVQYAHDRGILHRDLKPANIIVDAQDEPHISDFGLARNIRADSSLTADGAVLGTPSFMAPEQAAGKSLNLGAPADIYGLGAILYFLLTGRPPFTAASVLDTLVQVLEGDVVVPRMINPHIDRDLECICLRCLEKSPDRRYPTAAALAEDLERFVHDEPVKARPPGWRSLLLHWMRHQPALVSRLLGLTICLITAQLTFAYHRPTIPRGVHYCIMATLVLWMLLSVFCQWLWKKERWSRVVPYLWLLFDTVCLTAVLWFDETTLDTSIPEKVIPDIALPGPLVSSYAVLIVVSGLWFRVALVGYTMVLAILGYCLLVIDVVVRYGAPAHANWELIFLVLLVITGCAVAYQVHRVRALNRFYHRRL